MRKKIVRRIRGTKSNLYSKKNRHKLNASYIGSFFLYSFSGNNFRNFVSNGDSFSTTRDDTNISATFSNLSKCSEIGSTTRGE